MPTIFEIFVFKIIIQTMDHNPPHVHCKSPDGEVLIEIKNQNVLRNHGLHTSDIKLLKKFISDHKDVPINEWRHFHGEE